jgi:hypothetical protein
LQSNAALIRYVAAWDSLAGLETLAIWQGAGNMVAVTAPPSLAFLQE